MTAGKCEKGSGSQPSVAGNKNLFGFLNVNKPIGMTSHDVVAVLRRLTKIKQIGHTGTLDPFAGGVLPICIGKATRLIEYLGDDKAYLATVKFGSNTSTYDIEGDVTEIFDKKITQKEIIAELKNFHGEISQLPPLYSAIKVNGKKLYEYARKGESVEIKPRKVTIFDIVLKNFDESSQTADIFVKCSKGTYIRSIAFDLGKNLGCGGHLINLVRCQAGMFDIKNSVELEFLKEYPQKIKEFLINPLDVINLPKFELSENEHEKVIHGMALQNKTDYSGFVILVYNKSVSSIGFIEGDKILVKKVFE